MNTLCFRYCVLAGLAFIGSQVAINLLSGILIGLLAALFGIAAAKSWAEEGPQP